MRSFAVAFLVASGADALAVTTHIDSAGAVPPKTVAVLYFDNNTGARDYDNLGRGMASMMSRSAS